MPRTITDKVLIYSAERGAYWRTNSRGYTTCRPYAGLYERFDAQAIIASCSGRDERIEEITPQDRMRHAAPELLEALRQCLHELDHAYNGASNFAVVAKGKARTAIENATLGGQTQ